MDGFSQSPASVQLTAVPQTVPVMVPVTVQEKSGVPVVEFVEVPAPTMFIVNVPPPSHPEPLTVVVPVMVRPMVKVVLEVTATSPVPVNVPSSVIVDSSKLVVLELSAGEQLVNVPVSDRSRSAELSVPALVFTSTVPLTEPVTVPDPEAHEMVSENDSLTGKDALICVPTPFAMALARLAFTPPPVPLSVEEDPAVMTVSTAAVVAPSAGVVVVVALSLLPVDPPHAAQHPTTPTIIIQ